jgi:TM2 domain-containing membrane protein YozV
VAVVLSFFVPGLGQLYKGLLGRAVVFFLGTIVGLLVFVLPGVFVWFWNLVDAYNGPAAE